MAKFIPESEYIGKKYGRLTIIEFMPSIRSGGQLKRMVIALCECGKRKEFLLSSLTRNLTKSCGCYRLEELSKNKFKHGQSNSELYSVWAGMKRRCYNQNEISYKHYGARGISVCDEWVDNFQAFYSWAINNGYSKGLEIDREDNDGNYSPENCRWVTPLVNSRNRSISKIIEFNGQKRSAGEWAEITGINYGTLISRLNRGRMTIEQALTPLAKSNL